MLDDVIFRLRLSLQLLTISSNDPANVKSRFVDTSRITHVVILATTIRCTVLFLRNRLPPPQSCLCPRNLMLS